MQHSFVTYLTQPICLCILICIFTIIPTHFVPSSPSDPANTYAADAWCYAESYDLFIEAGAQAHAWSIPYSMISNEYTYGDYDARYGDVRVKWYPDPPPYQNKGVFNDGCSEWASHTETYWFIGTNDFSARSKAFVRNQDGHASDTGRW